MHVITQGGSAGIYVALGCVSHPLEEREPPTASLPETEGASTRTSKKGVSSQRNPRGGMLIIVQGEIACICDALGCVSHPLEERATTIVKGTSSKAKGN